MESKVTCNNFNEFLAIAENNVNAVEQGKSPVNVESFWNRKKGVEITGMGQAAILGLFKNQLLSASGEGSKTKFYLSGIQSPTKFIYRVRSVTFELISAYVIIQFFTLLLNARNGVADAVGVCLSVAALIVYGLRFFRILHLGPLVANVPGYLSPIGLVSLVSVPVIRGLTTFMSMLTAGLMLLFFFRMTGTMGYPDFEPSWSFLPDSILKGVLLSSISIGFLWVVGLSLHGETKNAQKIINKNGLQKLYSNDNLIDPDRVSDTVKGYGFIFGMVVSFYAVYIFLNPQWI